MGIKGLIPFLEKATETIHIEKFRGKVVAVDSSCLLHKGAYSCAYQIVLGQETKKHIEYSMKYVKLLLSLNIKPIMVFDGQSLAAKKDTNAKRREQRKEAKLKAIELLRQGKSEEARKYLNAAVEITYDMAHQLMVECRKLNVDSITAPYESDSQLCYLNFKIADAVISEDSDLVLFGCKTVLFKLSLNGDCLMLDSEKIHLSMNCSKEKFSFDKFRMMCILSGCDYLNSLPGIGLAKALKFVNMTEQTDIRKALKKIPSYLNLPKIEITEEYITDFLKANATFKHMYVFDPTERKMIRLNELDDDSPDYQYCTDAGTLLDNKTAFQLALGNLDPKNLSKVIDDFDPDTFVAEKPNSNKFFCNFPNIWKRSQAETETLPEKIIPKQKKLTLRPKTTDVLPKMDSAVFEVYKNENEIEEFDENDIISKYSCSSSMQPLAKKHKMVHDFSPVTHVNPFFKSSNSLEMKGKHQELKEFSLVKQTSPVVNKFKKTVVNENQRVVSRFFTNKSNSMEVNRTSLRESCEAIEVSETSSTEITHESQNSTDAILFENKSGISETNGDSQRSDISESTNSRLESLAIVDSKEPIDLELYEFNKTLFKNSSNEKSTTVKKQTGCRRPGLSRNAKPKNSVSATQMKLSSFGFQKKPTI